MSGTVTIRMYDVGFGDAFVVTVDRGGRVWRMLVDCGVHSQGRARPITESVAAIVADLTAAGGDDAPHLDVVVATHHHADHIVGFAEDAWEKVSVGEVWVPFVEDPDDSDAATLRAGQKAAALALSRLAAADPSPTAPIAAMLALNSSGNEKATDRLLMRAGRSFRGTHTIRYLPSKNADENAVATSHPDVVAHVLGPSRDAKDLKRMDPPTSARWLALDGSGAGAVRDGRPLFAPAFVDTGRSADPTPADVRLLDRLDLDRLGEDELLLAASVLENAVNNTSVFFVLDVAGVGLLFPGDSQEGAWDHVLDDEQARRRVAGVAFVKIAHHGSGNATPRRLVDEVLPDGRMTMLPFGLVKRWAATIPQTNLMAALAEHHHTVVRADDPHAGGDVTVDENGLWSQLTIDLP